MKDTKVYCTNFYIKYFSLSVFGNVHFQGKRSVKLSFILLNNILN